jgi:hypothetical protein
VPVRLPRLELTPQPPAWRGMSFLRTSRPDSVLVLLSTATTTT